MPRGQTLASLLTDLREETGRANSSSLGQNELAALKARIRRTYRWLHQDYEWPHLKIRRDKTLNAGDRYIALPADLDIERVQPTVECKRPGDTDWYPLGYGIDRRHFNFTDSDANEREDYPSAWQIYENDQIEIWPIPSINGITLRFHGFSRPKTLVNDADTCDLDSDLVVLYAAARQLKRDKSPDADDVAQQARVHYQKMKGRLSKSPDINMAKAPDRHRRVFHGPNIDFAERYD